MASNFGKLFSNATKHAVAGSSLLKATRAGHIYSIKLDADTDNGCLVAKGDWEGHEYYAEKAVTTFAGKIIDQAPNGNWYIQVIGDTDALLVLSEPLVYEQFTSAIAAEDQFYNAAGDLARCYELYDGDIFELSAVGISGAAAKGASVSCVSRKVTVG